MATSTSELDEQMENCVKLKGLPFKATTEDLACFFTGFAVPAESILLKRHPDGRPNGEAFVFFECAEEARRALSRDREVFGDKFGDRYVRVYPVLESDAAEMQAALQQSASAQQGNSAQYGHSDSVIKIKSLPYDANQLDIIQFFEGFRLKPNGVQLVVRSDNKPTGEAFVDFESVDEAARSVRERDHKVFSDKFGDRYVRLIQVSRKEMQATLALRFGGEGILKMKGIPFKATALDVRKFFSTGSYRIKADGISFIMHADGRPTGMAFIEFDTPQDAVRAMEKDRAKFGAEYGDRFCMLQLVGRHEMAKVTLLKESDNVGAPGSSSLNKGGGMYSGMQAAAAMQAAALGNTSLLNNPLLSIPWLQQMGLLNPALLNPNSDLRRLGMPGPGNELGQLGLDQISQLQALSNMASKGMLAGGHNNMGSHLHMGQLQQPMQFNPMLEALMAGQQMNGLSGLGGHGLTQHQAMSQRMSSDMAMSQHRMSSDVMVPQQRMSSDLMPIGRDRGGEAEEESPWMVPKAQSSDLANAASSWLYYRQQQQEQDWARAAAAEAREFNPSNWTEQLAE